MAGYKSEGWIVGKGSSMQQTSAIATAPNLPYLKSKFTENFYDLTDIAAATMMNFGKHPADANTTLTSSGAVPSEAFSSSAPHATNPTLTDAPPVDSQQTQFLNSTNSPPPLSPDSHASSDLGSGTEDVARRGSESSMLSDEGEHRPDITMMSQRERRMSREWDAALVPPSRFQKLQGSIMATPASRDGRVPHNRRHHHHFREKVKQLAHKGGDKSHE